MHVNGCARCQALVNELTEAADALPLLAPEIEPPVGFEQRVLSSGRARRRRSVRRLVVGGGRRGRGRGHPEHHDRPRGRVRERRDERDRHRGGEADRGEDGERERCSRRVGLRHEPALGRDRARLRLEDRALRDRGAAARGLDRDHRHDGDRERSRFVDGHESRRHSGRAARSCSSTPTASTVLPRNDRLSPVGCAPTKLFLVELEGYAMRTFRVLVLAALAAGSLALMAPGAGATAPACRARRRFCKAVAGISERSRRRPDEGRQHRQGGDPSCARRPSRRRRT